MRKYFYKNRFYKSIFIFLDFCLKIVPEKSKKKEKFKKIVILNPNHLGDMIISTPFLAALRKMYVDSHITLVCASSSRNLIETNPNIDEIAEYDPTIWNRRKRKSKNSLFQILRKGNFDLLFDLKGDPRFIFVAFLLQIQRRIGFANGGLGRLLTDAVWSNERVHQAFNLMQLLSPLGKENKSTAKYDIFLSERNKQTADKFVSENLNRDFVVLHPTAGYPSKSWPIEHWKILARILERKYDVVVVGADDADLCFSGIGGSVKRFKGEIRDTAALIQKAKGFVGLDSALGHIAASVGTRGVSVFSPVNNPNRWRPLSDKISVITRKSLHGFCEQRECSEASELMAEITPEEVFDEIEKVINEK